MSKRGVLLKVDGFGGRLYIYIYIYFIQYTEAEAELSLV